VIRVASIGLIAAWTIALTAQAPTPAAQPSSPQQPIRTTTLLVEVDTIVTDGKDQFVTGLTADDFEVLEDGRPQKIERIYIVAGTAVTGAHTVAPAEPASTSSPLPTTAPPRTFVLLLDQEHLQAGAFKRLRDAAITFLTSEFKPGDVGGVVIGSNMVGNRLTSDREELLTAVRNAKATAEQTTRRLGLMEWPPFKSDAEAIRIALFNDRDVIAQVVRRACPPDDPLICKNLDPEPLVLNKARTVVGELRPPAMRTVRTLQALASGLARLPGRKTIVLMTEGFFVEESWADLRQIVGVAARSNVRIYSLDARGLDSGQLADIHQVSVMDPGGGMPLEAYNTAEDGPNMLAVDTGGYAIRHTNKFADALAEIARDTSHYYVIGYSPTNPANDGSFRKITVRAKRSGLKVRARRGYLASAGSAGTSHPPEKPPNAPSQPATSSPPIEAGIPSAPPIAPPADPASVEPKAAPPPAERTEPAGFILRPDAVGRVRDLASAEGERDDQGAASRGWGRYQKGDLEGAAELLGAAAADPNARPWVRYAFGYSQLALRHLETAAETWEKVRAVVPEFRAVYLDLADAYMQMENYGGAINVLKAAEARWSGDVDVLNAMGTIQVRRGALDDAITTFRKATVAKPDDALAFFNLARTYELRYFKRRRYSSSDARWLSDPADIKNAVAGYEQYVKLGGPYEAQARTAIQNLQWQK
jgi:VWFA-related protein